MSMLFQVTLAYCTKFLSLLEVATFHAASLCQCIGSLLDYSVAHTVR